MDKSQIAAHFDRYAPERDNWTRRNRYYYESLKRLCREQIPSGKAVLELGCGTGDLLAGVQPSFGLGLDLSRGMILQARKKHPRLHFLQGDAEALPLKETFDFVILSDLVGHLDDVHAALGEIRRVCKPDTRIILTYYNFVWQPILMAGERLGLKMPQQQQNWLGMADIRNLFYLWDYEIIEEDVRLLLPKQIPLLSSWLNQRLAGRPVARWAALMEYFVARPLPQTPVRDELTCSVIIPCRNEVGNVVPAVERLPEMGGGTEIIFVDGQSTDGTVEEIERQIVRWKGKKQISLIHQMPPSSHHVAKDADAPTDLMLPSGKGDAVRKGFAAARGDVLMILDADLTVPPEDLPKFFKAIAQGKGRFINGTRLVYPLEDEAMKFFNMIGNKAFSWVFTWLLGQRIKDTLCGTKVLLRSDYERIAAARSYFGDFDPFGDFDLLFGAARLGLPIVEVPVRYRRRTFGDSKVRLVKHGVLLLWMSWIGFRKLKLGGFHHGPRSKERGSATDARLGASTSRDGRIASKTTSAYGIEERK
jgi:SAM-dependent methyltransferase/glycosyltransferase involved in cell wall biosynthesis